MTALVDSYSFAMRFGFVPALDPSKPTASLEHVPTLFSCRFAAQAAGDARRLLQAVARGRLAAVGAVLAQRRRRSATSWRNAAFLSPQNLNLALQRANQAANLGAENHPYLDSMSPTPRHEKSRVLRRFLKHCRQSDSPSLAVIFLSRSRTCVSLRL